MRFDRDAVLAVIAIIGATAGCAQHKSQTLLPGTALAAAVTSPTTPKPTTIPTTPTTEPTTVPPTEPPVSTGTAPVSRFLYVANSAAGTISELVFDPAKGTFEVLGAAVQAGGALPWALAADPSGRFLYCLNRASSDISLFAIDPETGALKALPAGAPCEGSPLPKQTAHTGTAPTRMALSPDGSRLVVVNRFDATLSSYRVNPTTGMLTPAHLMVFANHSVPTDIAFGPGSDSFFVSGGPTGFVGRVSLGVTGLMKQVGPTVHVGDAPSALAVDPTGRHVVAVTHPNNKLWTLKVDAKGHLEHNGNVKVAGDPSDVAFDPMGGHVYVTAKNAGKLFSYTLDEKGRVGADGSPVSTGACPVGVALDSSGKLVYTANSGDGTLSVFGVDPRTHAAGVATSVKLPAGPDNGNPGPRALAVVR